MSLGEIKKKLNNKSSIIDFFREQGKSFYILSFIRIILSKFYIIQLLFLFTGSPWRKKGKDKIFFIYKFFIKFKLLKLGQVGGYNLPYFSKLNLLTKENIIDQFTGDNELIKYVPDNCNRSTVTRSFLLSVLFNVNRNKYLALYDKYKRAKIEKSTAKGKIFEIDINGEDDN